MFEDKRKKNIFSKISIKLTIILIILSLTSSQVYESFRLLQGPPPRNEGLTKEKCGTTKEQKFMNSTIIRDDAKGSSTGYPGGYLQINTDNCPPYDWTTQTTPNTAMRFKNVIKLPLQPKISTNKFYVGIKDANGNQNSKAILGGIGVSVNGVNIASNADGDLRDAFIHEGQTFDKCGGHPGGGSDYHYHEEPPQGCVFSDTPSQHSPLFGVMYDGIPIFGILGDNGIVPADLDECGGHVDKTYPFYHYHLPKNRSFPYTLNCLRGCIFSNQGNSALDNYVTKSGTCSLNSTQYDYSSFFNSINRIIVPYNGTAPLSADKLNTYSFIIIFLIILIFM